MDNSKGGEDEEKQEGAYIASNGRVLSEAELTEYKEMFSLVDKVNI